LIAIIYVINLSNNLISDIINFISTFTLSEVPGTGLSLPAPSNPTAHIQLYTTAFQFSLGIGVLEIVILALRVGLHSSVVRKSEKVENIVFWRAQATSC
jgi:hypothetical protein